MNKILQTSKKIFKFTISRAFFLFLGIGLALVVYKIQAWTPPITNPASVTSGTSLTASFWNTEVRDKMIDLDTRVDLKAPIASPTFTGTATFNGDIKVNTISQMIYEQKNFEKPFCGHGSYYNTDGSETSMYCQDPIAINNNKPTTNINACVNNLRLFVDWREANDWPIYDDASGWGVGTNNHHIENFTDNIQTDVWNNNNNTIRFKVDTDTTQNITGRTCTYVKTVEVWGDDSSSSGGGFGGYWKADNVYHKSTVTFP